MNKKQTISTAVLVVILLAVAYWYGGDAPGLQGWSPSPNASTSGQTSQTDSTKQPQQEEDTSTLSPSLEGSASSSQAGASSSALAADNSEEEISSPQSPDNSQQNNTQAQEKPPVQPSESQQPSSGASSAAGASSSNGGTASSSSSEPDKQPQEQVCTISVSCSTVLDHLDWLDPDKVELIPQDGMLLSAVTVPLEEGESAFSLLQRLTREQGIPMEASFTPGTGSAYVEGIGNLYEFDCGQRSGWLYLVNGVSPGYSCSEYLLQPGDRLEWVYTCDMGADVGATPVGG